MVGAFNYHQKAKLNNTESTGSELFLHGNKIAEWREDGLWITNAGWSSNTTKERLNGVRGVSIYQKNFAWYLNGKEWDGRWIRVADLYQKNAETERKEHEAEGLAALRTVGMVAALGDIFHHGDQKAANDWKERMLKAGLENRGLIMPDDWDSLDEETKQARLDGAIKMLNEKPEPPQKIKERLQYLRGEIEAERISYGEIAELQSLREYIHDDDVLLLEWAGVSEEEYNERHNKKQ